MGLVGCDSKVGKAGEAEVLSEIQLNDIRDDLEIWSLLENTEDNFLARKKIAESVLRKLILVRSVSPHVPMLKAEALETLCLLSSEESFYDHVEDDVLVNIARKYLKSIENDVVKRIGQLQETMKSQGCLVSP